MEIAEQGVWVSLTINITRSCRANLSHFIITHKDLNGRMQCCVSQCHYFRGHLAQAYFTDYCPSGEHRKPCPYIGLSPLLSSPLRFSPILSPFLLSLLCSPLQFSPLLLSSVLFPHKLIEMLLIPYFPFLSSPTYSILCFPLLFPPVLLSTLISSSILISSLLPHFHWNAPLIPSFLLLSSPTVLIEMHSHALPAPPPRSLHRPERESPSSARKLCHPPPRVFPIKPGPSQWVFIAYSCAWAFTVDMGPRGLAPYGAVMDEKSRDTTLLKTRTCSSATQARLTSLQSAPRTAVSHSYWEQERGDWGSLGYQAMWNRVLNWNIGHTSPKS